MTRDTEMPELSRELSEVIEAERRLPPAPEGAAERVLGRLAVTLGWNDPGPAGAGGVGGASVLVAVVAAVGIGALGYQLARGRGGGDGQGARSGGPSLPVRGIDRPAADASLPDWFGAPERTPRAIAGRVILHGQPVVGARVMLMSDAARAGLVEPMQVVTGPDGRFDFGAPRAAGYDVSAIAPGQGYGYLVVDTQDPVATPPPDQLTVRLSGCDHVLYGTVRDASGGVIAGAEVLPAWNQWGWAYPRGAGAVTDGAGSYQLCTRAGPLIAAVRAEGYGSVTIQETVLDRRRFDVALVPEAVIVGRVIGQDGRPVANMLVRVWPAWTWTDGWARRMQSSNAITTTDADGHFRIAGVAPGRHIVFAAAIGLKAGPAPVVVDPGAESREVTLRAEPSAVVRGLVVDSGRPVPGARVRPTIGGHGRGGWVIAGAGGEFVLWVDIPPGPIGFQVEGHQVLAPAEHVAAAGPGAPAVVSVVRLAVIRGRILHRGQPAAGATVVATGAPLAEAQEVRADDDGTFTIQGLPAGSYRVQARSDEARAAATPAAVRTVVVEAGGVRDGITLDLDGAASITGKVLDAGGAPLPGVRVQYRSAGGDTCQTDTGDAGEFRCDMLAGGGEYLPTVRPDGAPSPPFPPAEGESLPGAFLADGSSRMTGQILRVRAIRARITGRVVDASAGPRADVAVRALDASAGHTPATAPWVGVRTVTSDEQGRFAIDVWMGGRYLVNARAPEGDEATVEGIRAGSTGIQLRLGGVGRIRGQLTGFDGVPDLVIRRIGNTVDFWRASVDGSSFVADRLAPGEYAVLASSGHQGAGERVRVQAGADTEVTLRPRPAARLHGTVVDLVTGRPVAGVRCKAAPYVPGAGIYLWGTPFAPPTDEAGRFTLAAPSGSIEATCEKIHGRIDAGAARAVVRPGEEVALTVTVVVSETAEEDGNGIGARFIFAHDERTGGHRHTIGELRPGGAAARAGLQVGDAIVAIDERDVTPLTGLDRFLGTYRVGDPIQVTIDRSGTALTVAVVIEPRWR